MKKICVFFILLFFAGKTLFPQITFTSSDFADVNDSFMVSKVSSAQLINMNFSQAGANVAWNFDSLVPSTQKYEKFISPDYSGYKLNWITDCKTSGGNTISCNNSWNSLTNICQTSNDTLVVGSISLSNIASLFYKDNNVFKKTIAGMTVDFGQIPYKIIADYDPADSIYRFPMQYLNSDSCYSSYVLNLTPTVYVKYFQKRVNFVEGWGSLSIPYGSFASVLKLKTLVYHHDTTFYNGSPTTINQTTDILYQWFDTAYGIPVLKVEGKISGSSEVYMSAKYIDSVRCLSPSSHFAFTPLVPYLDATGKASVVFTNLSTNCDGYSWSFGDGSSSVLTNPNHDYSSAGTFTVRLIGSNSVCSPVDRDTSYMAVVVKDSNAVAANFSYSPLSPCTGDTVSFTNLSLNANQYSWDFGDGSNSSSANPVHIFSSYGTFDVRLIATDGNTNDTMIRQLLINTSQVDAGNDTSIFGGDTAYLSVSPANGVIAWSIDSSLSCFSCTNPFATPDVSATYYVSRISSCGTGSDSVRVTVIPVFHNILFDSICSGDSLLWRGSYYSNSGVYYDSLKTIDQKDSIYELNLTVNPSYHYTQQGTICSGDSLLWQGTYYSTAGQHIATYQTTSGCDSIYELNLTVNPSYHYIQQGTICSGDSLLWQGTYYSTAGQHIVTYQSASGCDSIYELNLTVNPSYHYTQQGTICSGDSLLWQGTYYSTAGQHIATYQSASGCDSIYELNLTVNPSYHYTQQGTICSGDSLLWQGTYYSTAGQHIAAYQSTSGCDSIYELNLTVNPGYHYIQQGTICSGDSLLWQGTYYSTAGQHIATYQTTSGCDSIYELNLTVNQNYVVNDSVKICNKSSYTFADGTIVTNITQTFFHISNLTSINGCDSIIKTTVSPIKIDTSVQQSGNVLTASLSNSLYQWLDCNGMTPISGENSQNFVANTTGNYAVEITNNGCTDTSYCHKVILAAYYNMLENSDLKVFPNPNDGLVNIKGANINKLLLINSGGQVIREIPWKPGMVAINFKDSPAGLYFIKITTDKKVYFVKIIKR